MNFTKKGMVTIFLRLLVSAILSKLLCSLYYFWNDAHYRRSVVIDLYYSSIQH